MFYQDPSQVITAVQSSAKRFPHINALIDRHDYKRWEKRLKNAPDFEKELTEAPTFNLLNLLSSVHLEQQYPALLKNGTPVIQNLENWLTLFPELAKDDVFRGKIKNLDRDNFLSTLSELLLAAGLHGLGYKLKFEHKFTIPATNGNRDVDLTITTSNQEVIHIEVYSPYMPAHDGFFGLDDDDVPFSKKVAFKMDDKFGAGQVNGLNGKVLVAVDVQKIDSFHIRKQLAGRSNDDTFLNLANYLPPPVDGCLFYRGDITAANQSFIFEQIVLKK